MRLDDFDFALPEALIATRPARPRSSARLLVVDAAGLRDRVVTDLPALLRPGDRLVLNNTRVIPARLAGSRTRGPATARIEVTLIEPAARGGVVNPSCKLLLMRHAFGSGAERVERGRS
mgnify:CR=1 FL=1